MEFEKAREGQAFVPFVQPSKDHNLPLNYRKAQAALLVVRFWPSAVMICIEALGAHCRAEKLHTGAGVLPLLTDDMGSPDAERT